VDGATEASPGALEDARLTLGVGRNLSVSAPGPAEGLPCPCSNPSLMREPDKVFLEQDKIWERVRSTQIKEDLQELHQLSSVEAWTHLGFSLPAPHTRRETLGPLIIRETLGPIIIERGSITKEY